MLSGRRGGNAYTVLQCTACIPGVVFGKSVLLEELSLLIGATQMLEKGWGFWGTRVVQ